MQEHTFSDSECRQLYAAYCANERRGALKFVDTYGNRLLHYIRKTRLYDSPEDWEDTLQKVFIKIFRNCGKDVPQGGCVALLIVIAKHQAIDDLRDGAVRSPEGGFVHINQDSLGDEHDGNKGEGELLDTLVYQAQGDQYDEQWNADPEKWLESLQDKEELDSFYEAIKTLPQTQRQAVWLYLSGYSRQEMAACMREGEETVKTYLRLAKHNLKKKLQP